MSHSLPKGQSATIGLLVLCAGAMASSAVAQCDWDRTSRTLPSTSGVYHVCTSGPSITCYTPTGDPDFTPDRRPVYRISLTCGDSCRDCNDDNPLGQTSYWADYDWDYLESILQGAFDAGFRRIVLYNPGGNLPGSYMPQSSFFHLKDEQIEMIEDDLAGWISGAKAEDSSFTFGIVLGSWQTCDPRSPCRGPGYGGGYWDCDADGGDWDDFNITSYPTFFNPEVVDSMNMVYQNMKPWIDAGCDEFWFDNTTYAAPPDDGGYSGPNRLIDLAESPNYDGVVRVCGEAIPRDGSGEPDTNYTEVVPWYASFDPWVADKHWLEWNHADEVFVDPETTELGVCFRNPANYDIEDVASARDHGFVAWVINHAINVRYIQRVYDGDDNEFYYALLTSGTAADFDGDGTIDCNDYSKFAVNWIANYGNTDPDFAFWDGDIYNDGIVNCTDLIAFTALHDWSGCLQVSCP